MQNPEKLIKTALVIAIIALCLSAFSTIAVIRIHKKLAETEETVSSMEEIVDRIGHMVGQLEVLDKLMPKLQQLLGPVPTK